MVRITRRRALVDILAMSGVAVAGCARNPVTGRRELMLVSEEDEIAMGREAHPQILSAFGSYKDKPVQGFMDDMGQDIVKISHRSGMEFTFTVLDNPVVNAFAVPGGYVYFNRGIMAYFNDEAQFAGVLGHEIGHITARHSAAQISKQQLAQLGLGLGTIFSETFQRYSELLSLGASVMFLKFSRDDERQADQLGVQYSSKIGYDAMEMSRFFGTLSRLTPRESQALPEWQSTHPDPGNRTQTTARLAEKIQSEHRDRKYIRGRNDYLEMIDGLVYGDDPKNGYVEKGVFYHPDLKFQFPVPKGWRVANQPEEVRLYPDDQRVLHIFTIEPGRNPRDAAARFSTQNQIYVAQYEDISIRGLRAFKTLGEIQSQPPLAVLSHFIMLDKLVFAFHGISAPFDLDSYDTTFDRTATGFQRLTDPARINVELSRVRLRSAPRTQSLRDTLNGFDVPEERLKELAVLNGMELGDRVEPGLRIKVID